MTLRESVNMQKSEAKEYRIAIFASGSGSNAENLVNAFENDPDRLHVVSIYCNNAKAGVLGRAKRLGVPAHVFKKEDLEANGLVDQMLQKERIDYIILAGFLLKIPQFLVDQYEDRILNIHPALLPKYGGKGMYGSHVHHAVINSGENESGITIHKVNENYDEGAILFQAKCKLAPDETVESLQKKIASLEHKYFPAVVKAFILNEN